MRHAYCLLFAGILVAACSGTPAPEVVVEPEPVVVKADASVVDAAPVAAADEPKALDEKYLLEVREGAETFVDLRFRDKEKPNLSLRPQSKRFGLRFDTDRPTAEQVPELIELLGVLADKYPEAMDGLRFSATVFYDTYPEYSERLARHALDDPRWRKRKKPGTPLTLNRYIEETTCGQDLHPELDEIFASIGKRVEISSNEKWPLKSHRSALRSRKSTRNGALCKKCKTR